MIILLGVPRAGKTTMGREVAKTLNLPFYDLDERVLQRSMKIDKQIDSLQMLVKKHGEKTLRKLEKEEMIYLQKEKTGVLALGGGALLGEFELSEFLQNGIYVHLSLSFERFLERVLLKPLPLTCKLQSGWYEGLLTFYKERHEAAAKVCHATIDASCSPNQLLDTILTHLKKIGGHGE